MSEDAGHTTWRVNDTLDPPAPSNVERMSSAEKKPKEKDSLKSWIVCVVATILFCGSSVGFRCSGVLLVSIAAEFDVPKGEAVWPITVQNLCINLVQILAAFVAQKFPLRPIAFAGAIMSGLGFVLGAVVPNLALMTVFFGVIHGSGLAFLLVAYNTLLTQYFDRFRGLAFGIAHSSSPLASMMFPSLINFVKTEYGFRNAMLTVGIILLSAAPLSLLVKDAPWAKEQSTSSGHKSSASGWSIFREPMFYILLAPNLVLQWSFDTFLATVVDFGVQRGLSVAEVLFVLACFSVADIIGRISLPAVADAGLIGRDTLLTLCYFASCVFLLLTCASSSLWHFLAIVSILGGFFGLSSSYVFGMVGRYIGQERLSFAFGMMGAIGGFMFLVTPAALSFFKDHLDDYRLMYLLCTGILLVTSLPLVGVVYRRKIGRSLEVPE